jgi:phosphoglucomutase
VTVNERAGRPAEASALVDVEQLVKAYYEERPDPGDSSQQVAFGTSGHRGSALKGSFNEDHILATTEAICRYREAQGIDGPLFLGRDTHALSKPAQRTALEVLVAHGVAVRVDSGDRPTPTPALSHAILAWNRDRRDHLADGIVVTPSHNPPEDGGFKYNPPNGGPADTDITGWVQDEANRLLRDGLDGVRRLAADQAAGAPSLEGYDYVAAYVDDLASIVDLEAVRGAGLRLGVDPLGGAAVDYWGAIAERYDLDLEVVNQAVDPTFRFMTVDWDGKIRMDPSSRYAMAGLIDLRERFDVAFANDADADRHGIVTGGAGLLNPNHYLAAMVGARSGSARRWSPAA